VAGNSKKAVIAALVANGGIALAKFVGFGFTRSSSMLAESVHSVADTGNQALLLFGGQQAEKEATERHPFGYGRERYFWSFVVAIVLFALGALFALYEGEEKIRSPHEPESPGWAFAVLSIAIVMETFSFRTALLEGKRIRAVNGEAGGWLEFIRRSKEPEIAVVLLEDFGAIIGLVLAFLGVTLAVTVDPIWDGIGTLAIGFLLAVLSVVLMVEMKSLLIGESASPADADVIREVLLAGEDVDRVIHMRTMHLGPEELLVAAKVQFRKDFTAAELVVAIDEAEDRVRSTLSKVGPIYLEPDFYSLPTRV